MRCWNCFKSSNAREEEPLSPQSPKASPSKPDTEPCPTVESTTEEQNALDAESTETPAEPSIEQEDLIITIQHDDKLLHDLGQTYDTDQQETPHSDIDVMFAYKRSGQPLGEFELTKLTPDECESEQEIEIAERKTYNKVGTLDGDYQQDSEDAVLVTATNSEEETGDTECMYICERCVVCFETDEAYESHSCTTDKGQNKRKRSCKTLSEYQDVSYDPVPPNRMTLTDTQFECPHCSETYERDSQLLQHCRLYHQDEFEIFRCNVCTEEYASQSALTEHIESHHQTGYRCRFCNKMLRNSFALKSHENVHTRQRPFSCTVCDKKFAQYTSMWRHMSIHNDIKAYECDLCKQRFRQKSVMVSHRRTHTGERPYKCEECSKCFGDHSTLAKHRRVHAKGRKENHQDKK
uniref:C2H2-type domain-containing protein n=1 Tax=Anopheles christyi TaxID=43041 RepID=A0A182K658_9DIPT